LHPFFIKKTEAEGELNFTLKMNMKNQKGCRRSQIAMQPKIKIVKQEKVVYALSILTCIQKRVRLKCK
jgi:hypothetical protein